MDTYDGLMKQLDTADNRMQRVEERVDEVYDRVSEIHGDMKLLKYRVATFSAVIGAAFSAIVAFIMRKMGV